MSLSNEIFKKAGFRPAGDVGFTLTYLSETYNVELGYKTRNGLIVTLCRYTNVFENCKTMEGHLKASLEFWFDDNAASRAQKKHPAVQLLKEYDCRDGVGSIAFTLKKPTEKSLQELNLALREFTDITSRRETFVREVCTLLKKKIHEEATSGL